MALRTLLIINRSSGVGGGGPRAEDLQVRLAERLGGAGDVSLETVADHPEARRRARAFLDSAEGPAAIVVGGGGGTLRAVIEGVSDGAEPGQLPGPERVRIAPLRMGSGNILAKRLGLPRDPVAGIDAIGRSLREGRTRACCVMRCTVDDVSVTTPRVLFAATLGGFGQLGRVPGDLARWHARLPRGRRRAARALGIERLTDLEYALALLLRSAACALRPRTCEEIEVRLGERAERFRLFAGALFSFPLRALPFEQESAPSGPTFSFHAIPFRGRAACVGAVLRPRREARRARVFRIAPGERLEIRLLDRDRAEFFLDEDSETLQNRLLVEVAGTLAFVPGHPSGGESEEDVV